MMDNRIYKIKDSVDLFLNDNIILTAYFMNTRKRKTFKVNNVLVKLLEQLDGERNITQLSEYMLEEYNVAFEDVLASIEHLNSSGIITEKLQEHLVNETTRTRYNRQINYFSEFFDNEKQAEIAQQKLIDAKVLIFGSGAIGGNIAIQLAMAGVTHFTLFDYDKVEPSDIARHLYFSYATVGMHKVEALKNYLNKINPKIIVDTVDQALYPEADIEELVKGKSFVVNTLDEPYIGYTSAKISRICVKYDIPHFIGGGFDAHLASTGELVIPHITPCADCYVTHFTESLKGWKPKKHPVKNRSDQIGGLASMSLFSSSYATMEIIKTITNIVDMRKDYKVRGELMFKDFSLNYLTVKKDPNCAVCGKDATL